MSVTLNRHDRRGFLRFVRLVAAGTAVTLASGCAWFQQQEANLGTTAGSAAVQQVLADIQGGLTAISTVVTGAAGYLANTTVKLSNGTVTSITNAIASAQAGLGSLMSSVSTLGTSAGANAVQTVGNLLQAIVSAAVATLSTISGAGTWLTIAQAAAALMPGVFAFVSSLVPTMAAPASAPPHKYSVVAARQMLGIPTVAAR